MIDQTTAALLRFLGQVHATFAPWTTRYDEDAVSAIFDRRHQYSRSGLPLAGGGSASERKSHFQVMENARKSGYVNVSGRARPLLRFTDAGEQYLSALAGIECMASSRRLMQQIAALTDAGDTNTGFVLWHDLAGSESPSRLIRTAMPRLVRDQLESHSDGDGMVGFKISELGRDALVRIEKRRRGLPESDASAVDIYFDAYHATLDERKSWPIDEAALTLPLGSGSWPERASRK